MLVGGGARLVTLSANLMAQTILLLIERGLINSRQMPTVLARHVALFLTNLMVVLVQGLRLCSRQFPFFDFGVDARVLMQQSVIDFGATGVALRKRFLGACTACKSGARSH